MALSDQIHERAVNGFCCGRVSFSRALWDCCAMSSVGLTPAGAHLAPTLLLQAAAAAAVLHAPAASPRRIRNAARLIRCLAVWKLL